MGIESNESIEIPPPPLEFRTWSLSVLRNVFQLARNGGRDQEVIVDTVHNFLTFDWAEGVIRLNFHINDDGTVDINPDDEEYQGFQESLMRMCMDFFTNAMNLQTPYLNDHLVPNFFETDIYPIAAPLGNGRDNGLPWMQDWKASLGVLAALQIGPELLVGIFDENEFKGEVTDLLSESTLADNLGRIAGCLP